MVSLFAVRFVFDLVGCVILLCCVISVRPFGFVICFVFGWTWWLVCWWFWLVLGVLCALAGGLVVHFCLCVDCVCWWVWFCGFMLYVGLCWDDLVFDGWWLVGLHVLGGFGRIYLGGLRWVVWVFLGLRVILL